jgi:3-hydroxyacyl-CoA dehydrogenase
MIERIAIVGTGVIGASWAAYFLSRGLTVTATDPAPDAEAALRALIAQYWPLLCPGAPADAWHASLRFTPSLADAVAGAQFVQENGPERIAVKQALYAALDAAAPPGTILATSSSTLLISDVQAGCARHPERVVLGHPFNPPHLIPLVEVAGGARTSEHAIETAMRFYAAIGRKPVRLKREILGHIANRLQAALWQEAFHLLREGVASAADIDTAIAHGPGLRWALLGPFLNLHLSGGAGGIAHTLSHLGPATEAMWRDLGRVELDPAIREAVIAGVAEELAGRDQASMVSARDTVLLDLLRRKDEAADLP